MHMFFPSRRSEKGVPRWVRGESYATENKPRVHRLQKQEVVSLMRRGSKHIHVAYYYSFCM